MAAKTFVGFVAACELSCVKLRTEYVVRAAASGDILEVASGRTLRSSVEAVVAASRVRDTIVRFGGNGDDVGHAKLRIRCCRRLQGSPDATYS